jgi:hypothetical protein
MRKKISERMNPDNPGAYHAFKHKIKKQQMLKLLKQMAELYKDNPEKLKVIHQWIRDLEIRSKPGYSIAPKLRLPKPNDGARDPMYYEFPNAKPGDIVSEAGLHSEEDLQKMQEFLATIKANPKLAQQFQSLLMTEAPNPFDGGTNTPPAGAPNPFDGGTNTPPTPAGSPGKPRPGDAGIDLAEKIEDIKANSQVWTQSITNRIEDLVKAVASGDKRAARDLISDLKIDASEFIRYIADDAGVKKPMGRPPVPIKLPKPQQPKPQQPSTEDPFQKIVTSPANVKEAYAVRSGKKNIREAKPTAIKLAQKYNLTELKQLYSRAVNRRR